MLLADIGVLLLIFQDSVALISIFQCVDVLVVDVSDVVVSGRCCICDVLFSEWRGTCNVSAETYGSTSPAVATL